MCFFGGGGVPNVSGIDSALVYHYFFLPQDD